MAQKHIYSLMMQPLLHLSVLYNSLEGNDQNKPLQDQIILARNCQIFFSVVFQL